MNIVFRADANHNIGMGHIMRCLSIADACKSNGHNTTFIIAEDNVKNLIMDRGFDVFVLSSDYTQMTDELTLWPDYKQIDLIFIDSYYVTQSYFLALKQKFNSKLVYIDDLLTFPYSVDILINYNIYSKKVDYAKLYFSSRNKVPMLLLGPKYAPLRTMFKNLPIKEQKKHVSDVLISTGGSDDLHIASNFVKALLKQNHLKYTYHILIGALNQDKNELKKNTKGNANIILHENVSNMKDLLQSMDIVVSAAGSTLYEICACGVPLITYITADNQIRGAEAFEKLNLAVNIGDLREDEATAPVETFSAVLKSNACAVIFNAVNQLSDDYESRTDTASRMQKMIDGNGVERIIDEM